MRRCAPLVVLLLLGACIGEERPGRVAPDPYYGGVVEARFLAEDLIRVVVEMKGARDRRDVLEYAECAVSGYAHDRGFAFARQVRTQVEERGGVWSADAVYTVSSSTPRGLRTIDADVAVEDCRARGIPTV
ncbi:hypothetical protein JSE7799_00939 [Jannaschia seosinensis]|uniref:Lipoprotein n=1 Tax=Jannaschia seosinensis TaxID=313367 RepID=A0A0M7B8U8_9RHOB|nr:hypothetical protein [Jannaschia seosinensis]CUH32440.1 hypothetical protein JSE7799_00939 [Jannaschia seosinensis]